MTSSIDDLQKMLEENLGIKIDNEDANEHEDNEMEKKSNVQNDLEGKDERKSEISQSDIKEKAKE